MPAFRSNVSSTKDAESTDLSSLLNVLKWMKDVAFLGKTRVSLGQVTKLLSHVGYVWAYKPTKQFTVDKKAECFSIANDFLENLEKVFPNKENSKCFEHLERLVTCSRLIVVTTPHVKEQITKSNSNLPPGFNVVAAIE